MGKGKGRLKTTYNFLKGKNASVAAVITSGINTARGRIIVNDKVVASATGESGGSRRAGWVLTEARKKTTNGFNAAARMGDAEIMVMLSLEDQIYEADLDVDGGVLSLDSDLVICALCRRCIRVFCAYYDLTPTMSSKAETDLY
jgi:hypothetical protein